jgi:hypothetical protein
MVASGVVRDRETVALSARTFFQWVTHHVDASRS